MGFKYLTVFLEGEKHQVKNTSIPPTMEYFFIKAVANDDLRHLIDGLLNYFDEKVGEVQKH